MPLFRRSDGDLVKGLSPLRRMLPYLMPGRNEAVVYYEQILDLTRTLPFIAEWNRTHERHITVFHVVLAACGKALHARPGLNRFVSGRHLYQRRGANVSFAAKKRFADDAPIVAVKMDYREGEPFAETVARIHGAVGEGRSDTERTVDKEVKLGLALPGFLLALVLYVLRLLDRWNLLPAAMIRNDPLYASLLVTNLGSVGLDRAWHHLFEYGTVSLFAVIGSVKKRVTVAADGRLEARDTVRLRYSFDERINDGFYCGASLEIVRDYAEDPEKLLSGADAPMARAPAIRQNAL